MSEFFLELFSEEMPPNLQCSFRETLLQNIKNFLDKEQINYDEKNKCFSTPNRVIIHFKKIENEVVKKSQEFRGPNVKSSEDAINGFIKSNSISKNQIYKKKINNDEFYFYKSPKKKIKTALLLQKEIPEIISRVKWKKSMKWGEYNLYWGRPLKSIMALYENKVLKFKLGHLQSKNITFIDKDYENKTKSFKNYQTYEYFFKKSGILINHNERKKYIENKLNQISKSNNLKLHLKDKLLDEVTNIVEKPNIILCSFNKQFLDIPKEIITITIENYQKYFPLYDQKNNLTNYFFVVSDAKDKKGLIKKGNESVIEARLSDADYFWKKNKSQNMLKQVSELKKINYFNGLGTYYDKSQRLKKLGGHLSDILLLSKEKIEIASSICKVDLLSDLVNEFPELQGLLGGYFAEIQGFENDICIALKEQYLPIGPNSNIPKKNYSIALSITDKIDTLVGFFGLGMIPSGSKDPYALRRLTNGLVKIIILNKKNLRLKEIINYSCQLYNDQSIEIDNKLILQKLSIFIVDRLKNFMKENKIRQDIIESSVLEQNMDKLTSIFFKAYNLNKVIDKQLGKDIVENYKRASNILNSEKNNEGDEILGSADPGLFKNQYEKDLYKKINDIKKNFTSIGLETDFQGQLSLLASAKKEVSIFFDNVKVNDDDKILKKNRLELLTMFCKTFDNYINFTKVETQ